MNYELNLFHSRAIIIAILGVAGSPTYVVIVVHVSYIPWI